jgi:hypothetical protein
MPFYGRGMNLSHNFNNFPNYMILQVVFGIQPANAASRGRSLTDYYKAKQKLIGVPA